MEQIAEINHASPPYIFSSTAAANGAVARGQTGTAGNAARTIGPAALLLKPLIHDMAAGLENAATMLKMSQKAFQGDGAAKAGSHLESVNANLFKLMGLTEEYCSLLLSLDQKGEIPTGRYDLQADTIESVIHELADEIRRKEITVQCRRNKNAAYFPRPVQANRILLSSAFRTLFANAIKYCRQGGMITYGFSDDEKTHQVYISYEGQLTDVGRHTDQANSKAGNGTGYANSSEAFGLSMAHSVLQNYGGSLSCKPEANGSRFVVSLPA